MTTVTFADPGGIGRALAKKSVEPEDVFAPIRALDRERAAPPAITINLTINIVPAQEEEKWPIN